MLPNVEALTVRTYVRELLEEASEDDRNRRLAGNYVKWLVTMLGYSYFWPGVKTADFTRQCAPRKGPD